MSSLIDENTQFVDVSGAPFTGGFIYIGVMGKDPKLNPVSIFSDSDLTASIDNPQTLDSSGRSTNKIWVNGRYSMKVEDLETVQEYQKLDNGGEDSTGITTLVSATGADNIIATAATTIKAYVDKEIYIFTSALTNTGAVTLNIDGLGAKSVTRDISIAIGAGEMQADQVQEVVYNASINGFQWLNAIYIIPVGSALVLLDTIDVTTPVLVVNITGLDNYTEFNNFIVTLDNVRMDTVRTSNMRLRFGTGAGPTWDTGANYLTHMNQSESVFDTYDGIGLASSLIFVSGDVGAGADDLAFAEITISNPHSSTAQTLVSSVGAAMSSFIVTGNVSSAYKLTTPVTGIQFFNATSRLFGSGRFKLYGVR